MPNLLNYDIKDRAILHGTLSKSVRSCERIPFSSVKRANAVSLWSAQNEFSISIKHMEFFFLTNHTKKTLCAVFL